MIEFLEAIIQWQEAHPAILHAIGVVLYSLAFVYGLLAFGFIALAALANLCLPRTEEVTADNE